MNVLLINDFCDLIQFTVKGLYKHQYALESETDLNSVLEKIRMEEYEMCIRKCDKISKMMNKLKDEHFIHMRPLESSQSQYSPGAD